MERSLLASFPISEGDLENNYFKLLFLWHRRESKRLRALLQHDWFCPSYLLLYISIYQQGLIPPIAILHYYSILVYISPAKMLWCFSKESINISSTMEKSFQLWLSMFLRDEREASWWCYQLMGQGNKHLMEISYSCSFIDLTSSSHRLLCFLCQNIAVIANSNSQEPELTQPLIHTLYTGIASI